MKPIYYTKRCKECNFKSDPVGIYPSSNGCINPMEFKRVIEGWGWFVHTKGIPGTSSLSIGDVYCPLCNSGRFAQLVKVVARVICLSGGVAVPQETAESLSVKILNVLRSEPGVAFRIPETQPIAYPAAKELQK